MPFSEESEDSHSWKRRPLAKHFLGGTWI